MQKARHKGVILILTIMIIFGTLPGTFWGNGKAFAAGDFSGSGTSAAPYLIGTAEQLNKIRGPYLNANLYFKLTSNIDLSGYADWASIGNSDTPFKGHIDGDVYKITGLAIRKVEDEYVGLFGYIDSGSSLTRMKLENASVQGMQFVGALVGYNDGGTVSASYVSGNVSGVYNTGGLVGYSYNGTISDSHAAGTVSAGDDSASIGGLVGYSVGDDGSIISSYASVDVTVGKNSEDVGGLVGWINSGEIVNSYALGKVTAGRRSKDIGGLVGSDESVTFSNNYASGDVSGTRNVGGLIGNKTSNYEINQSYATGNVSGDGSVGGLVGRNYLGKINRSYATGEVNGNDGSSVGGLVGDNINGPIRDSHASGNVIGKDQSFFVGGLVGWSQPLDISGSYASGNVSGGNDLGGLVGYGIDGEISHSRAFGNVSGGYESQSLGGLIGGLADAVISKSYAAGEISGGDESSYVGGLAGNFTGEINNSYALGKVDGFYYVGGLVGYDSDGTVSTSYASGDVSGKTGVGGLVGYNVQKTISDSYATGKVSGKASSDYVGGLLGYNIYGTISRTYATGKVSGDGETGGLIGAGYIGTTINSFYDITTTGQTVSYGGDGQSTAAMQSKSTYEADQANRWDFSNTWTIDSVHNGGYPYLPNIQAYLDYDGNGSTNGTVPFSRSYMPGVTASVYSGTLDLTKTGYRFDGWNTLANGTGTLYKPGDPYTILSNTTLYANWQALSAIATITSTIGIVSTGGTSSESITGIPYGTTLAELKTAITPAPYATFEVYEADGLTVATALASGNKVIVTAQDGITKVTYTVSVAASSAKDLTAFSFAGFSPAAVGTINGTNVEVTVPFGTPVTSLIATFTSSPSSTVTVGVVPQLSGLTPNDFTSPVVYTVTAQDGTTKNYTVTVTVAASSAKDLTAFS
ncbi:beta strand repeat-containing protein, partial [Paenibacillus hodogayensis]